MSRQGSERSDAGLTEVSATAARAVPVSEGQCDTIFQRGVNMTGTQRLPGGERRKASQRHSRPAAPLQPLISRLWHPGDRVRWRDRIGVFRRDVGDSEHAEIVIADRTYRVRLADLA